jgi:tetratricopeptide (TPR) repeat protein
MMRCRRSIRERVRAVATGALALACLIASEAVAQDDGNAAPPLPADVLRVLEEADRAFLGGDAATAQAAYGRVLARVPDCKPALWGRAVALLRLGRDYQAWPLLDLALGSAPAPEACRAAARAAITAGPGSAGPDRLAAARRYLDMTARRTALSSRGPGPAPEELEVRAWLAQQSGRTDEAVRAWQSLAARRPESYAMAPWSQSRTDPLPNPPPRPVEWSSSGNWEHVRLALAACLALGAAWAVGLGILFLLGDALSRAALRLAERDGRGLAIPRGHATARGLYRAVIGAAAAYFDASVVVLVVLISAVPLGLIYGLATAAHVPGWAVPAAVLPCAAWLALGVPLARSLRVRPVEQAEGRLVRESEAPALWALAGEVARVVGTQPVDEVRLVTGADIGVSERGRPRDKRAGRATRCLMLGMATFDGFRLPAFRAVLAHEYAHLLHRDTARPVAAARLAARLNMTLSWIAFWRGNAWWNLGWHFVSAYHRFFRRVTRGADRFAEVHADRVAALAYGAGAAAEGLVHVIHRAAEHGDAQDRALGEALRPDINGPAVFLRNARAMRCRSIALRIKSEMTAPPHPDHTHPPAARRLELLRAIGRESNDCGRHDPEGSGWLHGMDESEADLWSLFADPASAREEYRRRCDAEVLARIDAHAALSSQTVIPYTEAVLDTPDRAGPYLARAEVFFRLGDLPAARRDLDAVLERNPWDAQAWYARGQVRMQLGDLAGAGEDLRKSISLSRAVFEPTARAALGDLAAASGDLVGAVAEYSKSIDVDRSNPELYLKRASARLRLGRTSQAATDFAKAAELDPESAEAQVGLAAAAEASGEFQRALAAARAAVGIDDAFPDGHLLLARLLLHPDDGTSPDVPQAIAHARSAVTLTRGDEPEANEMLARALALAETAGSNAGD